MLALLARFTGGTVVVDCRVVGALGDSCLLIGCGICWQVAICFGLHGSFGIRRPFRGLGGVRLLLVTNWLLLQRCGLLPRSRLLLGIGGQA